MHIQKHIIALLLNVSLFSFYGQTCFQKRIALGSSNNAFSRDIKEINPNKYALIGMSYDSTISGIENKLTFITVDSTGNLISRKGYGGSKFNYVNITGSSSMLDYAYGSYYSAISVIDSNNRQAGVLLKFNSQGDTLWQMKYYEPVNSSVFYMGVWPTVDGNLIILGSVENYVPGYNNHPLSCLYLQKCDTNGQKIWDKKYFASNLDNQMTGSKLVQDPVSKNFVVAGLQTNNSLNYGGMFLFDSIGNLIKNCGLIYPDVGFMDLIQITDGNFVAVGDSKYPTQILGMDTHRSYMVKFDLNLNPIYKLQFDSVATENGFYRIIELPTGDLLTSGALDVGNKLVNAINYIPRLLCTDKDGNYKWSKYYDNYRDEANFDSPLGIALTLSNEVIFTSSNYWMEPDPTTFMLYKVNFSECDEIAISCNGITGLRGNNLNNQMRIYPQPASNFCRVELPELSGILHVKITDLEGRILYELETAQHSFDIDLNSFQAGVYFVSVCKYGFLQKNSKLIISK